MRFFLVVFCSVRRVGLNTVWPLSSENSGIVPRSFMWLRMFIILNIWVWQHHMEKQNEFCSKNMTRLEALSSKPVKFSTCTYAQVRHHRNASPLLNQFHTCTGAICTIMWGKWAEDLQVWDDGSVTSFSLRWSSRSLTMDPCLPSPRPDLLEPHYISSLPALWEGATVVQCNISIVLNTRT